MKKNHLMTLPKLCAVALLGATTLLASCAVDGFKDESFVGTYGPIDLTSPTDITHAFNADKSTVTISWPAVNGAGKYVVSLYEGYDESVVIEENKEVKVNTVTFSSKDETNYVFKVRTLDNVPEGNISDGETAVYKFSSFVPAFAQIPAGTDLNQWFAENPIPETAKTELTIYELEGGGDYTISDCLNFDGYQVGLRTGNKSNHAKITYTSTNSEITTTAGMEIRYIDFDCSGGSSSKGVFGFSTSTTVPAANTVNPGKYKWTAPIILDPITITGCNFKNVNGYFFWDNKVKVAAMSLNIDNCVVELTPQTNMKAGVIWTNKGNSHINDFTLSNSTFYIPSSCPGNIYYFYQAGVSKAPDLYVDGSDYAVKATNSVNYKNSTFYRIGWGTDGGEWGNYNGMNGKNYSYWRMTDCIFFECSMKGGVPRRFLHGKRYEGDMAKNVVFANNTYMRADGAFQDITSDGTHDYDLSGTCIEEDPQFADPDKGDFHISGAGQVAKRTGDPRWLPEN